MNLEEAQALNGMDVDSLAHELVATRRTLKSLQEAEYLIAKQLTEVMVEQGSLKLRTTAGVVELKYKTGFSNSGITKSGQTPYEVLAGLREITDPLDLKGIYEPEEEVLLGYRPSENCDDEDRKVIGDLVDSKKLLPHTKVVPEKWNMKKQKSLSKLSSEHSKIIESARTYDPNPRLVISDG